MLNICGYRYYLLSIIDYFFRYIVTWGIVRTVTQKEVKDLLSRAYISQEIENSSQKTLIRMDKYSANMAYGSRRLIKDLEIVIFPAGGKTYRQWPSGTMYMTVKHRPSCSEIFCYYFAW